jgi:G:T-mismatch repair DNA endonuclease (very short patch repair protein)
LALLNLKTQKSHKTKTLHEESVACPKHATQPATNRAFWKNKFARNKARDRFVNRTLRQKGWKVLRIWRHELTRRNEARLIFRLQGNSGAGSQSLSSPKGIGS